jgi:hypothetical protein
VYESFHLEQLIEARLAGCIMKFPCLSMNIEDFLKEFWGITRNYFMTAGVTGEIDWYNREATLNQIVSFTIAWNDDIGLTWSLGAVARRSTSRAQLLCERFSIACTLITTDPMASSRNMDYSKHFSSTRRRFRFTGCLQTSIHFTVNLDFIRDELIRYRIHR